MLDEPTEAQADGVEDGLRRLSDVVISEVVGRVLVVTINRPEARNAINGEVSYCMGSLLAEAERDDRIRAIVVTGAGDKAFCAGADLRAVANGESLFAGDSPEHLAWGFGGYVSHYISKPTIAAVNGAAVGGGTELVLASDLAVASERAVFGLPEVKRGLIAGGGGAFRLPVHVPFKRGLELVLTGDTIDARKALELGFINRVVPHEETLDRAVALAERIASNAPLAIQASKRLAYGEAAHGQGPEAKGWIESAAALSELLLSADANEGATAFLEKRTPVWTGQ